MGTPDFAVASLKALHNSNHEIVGVVTTTDKKAGRGQKIRFSAVKDYALANELPLLQPEKLKDQTFINDLKELNADLFAVVAFRMLPELVWSMPEKGTINLHGSLLPNYRGAAPLNWAIINGEKESGATTFFIEKEIDTGKIIDHVKVEIGKNTTAGELHNELMVSGADLLRNTVDQISEGTAKAIPQSELLTDDHKDAPKIFKDTCKVDWTRNAQDVHNHIRGLSPYPAAWCTMKTDENEIGVKIYRSELTESNLSPGQINCNGKDVLEIGCSNGSIQVLELQMAGKKKMDVKSFLNGVKIGPDYTFI